MSIKKIIWAISIVAVLSGIVAVGMFDPRGPLYKPAEGPSEEAESTAQTPDLIPQPSEALVQETADLAQKTWLASESISIQQFSAEAGGTPVTPDLPIYKVSVGANGKLVDSSGNVFNSYKPQSTTPTSGSECVIVLPNARWKAYYTTFYVVPESAHNQMYLVRSCGKSPLQLNSTAQYPNINTGNFINHAQIAGTASDGGANKVIAAGEIDIVDGRVVYIDTCSGHYKPNVGSLLAYVSSYIPGPLALTSTLNDIISSGSITEQEISSNLIKMIDSSNITPRRNYRSGTGNCNSYTTVFERSVSGKTTTLTGGLLAYKQGNINIFQNNINTITNKNIKGIELTPNCCLYDYAAWVITDLHFWNNAMQFYFTDETDDTYSLSVHVYSYNHEVDYNSEKPNIKKIVFDINF